MVERNEQGRSGYVVNEFLVSKETVVLRLWERSKQNLVLSNELKKVELPP